MEAFASYAQSYNEYKNSTNQYKQQLDYIKSLYEVFTTANSTNIKPYDWKFFCHFWANFTLWPLTCSCLNNLNLIPTLFALPNMLYLPDFLSWLVMLHWANFTEIDKYFVLHDSGCETVSFIINYFLLFSWIIFFSHFGILLISCCIVTLSENHAWWADLKGKCDWNLLGFLCL